MPTPKTVQLFLLDGTPTGPIKCSLSNWTGRVFLVPRTNLKPLSKQRPDLSHNGVYLLFGSEETTDREMVYVGQARSRANGNGIAGRIDEHSTDRLSYFTHAIIITTTDDSFGPTEISYLENNLWKAAQEAERYKIANNNTPSPGNVTEEKQAELDEFIEYTKIAVGSLGYKVFQPLDETPTPPLRDGTSNTVEKENTSSLFFKGQNFHARGRQTADGFVILKGSTIRAESAPSCPPSRESYVEKFADSLEDFRLTKDILFRSPSKAAVFVSGRSSNGLKEWKSLEGVPLKDLEL